MDQPAEHVPQARTVSMMGQDIAARDPASAISHRSTDHSRGPSMRAQDRMANDVWTSAISRLQAQVSYNTGMLESHRRQFTEIEAAIGRLNQQMGEVVHAVNDVQREMRVRPTAAAADQLPRHDSGDLEVLAGQLQRLTNRVNEIDGMNMQLDLVKNRVKRLEEGGAAVAPTQHRPPTATYSREQATQDTPVSLYSQQQQHQQQAHYYALQHQAPQPQPHAPLPPMRTASMASPGDSRPRTFPSPGTLESQSAHSLLENQSGPPQASSQFQPTETLPPPSTLSGWRPAEQHHGLPGIGASSDHHPGRLTTAEPEFHHVHSSQASGWASINTNVAVKRPPEDRDSPYLSPSLDGSKRPRLAPLMPSSVPRSVQSSEVHGPAHSSFQSMVPAPAEVPFHPRARAPSDGSQSRTATTLGPSAGQHSFRFITSAQQAEGSPEGWRPEVVGLPQQHASPPGRGGGRRGGGRGRGRGRGRGGGGGGGAERQGSGHEGQEHGTPEWERSGTLTGQSSPNSGYQSIHPQPHSPRSAFRSTPGGRSGGFVVGPPERQNEFPATPLNPGSPHDCYTTQPDVSSGGSGKKTRTKPIRNAEGILIRKDGRPDMRSVSSANNLRKVHAKKEAERGDGDEDSNELTRSGTPTSAAAGEDLSDEPGSETHERHRELISRIYAHEEDTNTQDRYSATNECPRSVPSQSESGGREDNKDNRYMADVVMQDSRAQADDPKQSAFVKEHPRSTACEDKAIAA